MKNGLRIPRILLPRADFDTFACPAPDCRPFDMAFWDRAEREAGDISALRMTLPESYMGDEEEARVRAVCENAYRALEEDKLEKLVRGGIRTERTLPSGEVRKGIVLSLDLEQYSVSRGKGAEACASMRSDPARVAFYRSVLQSSPLEFPHAVMLYRDKKERIGRGLENEKLEKMYECELPCGGGKLAGYFLPADLADDVSVLMHARLGPSFVTAEGNASLAAAKARWEEVKKGLTPSESLYHPARFALAEFVDLYDESVKLYPVHRLLSETDAEAAADFLSRNVRCRREGNVLVPAVPAGGEGARRIDALLSAYLRANGGKKRLISDAGRLRTLAEDDASLGILLKAPEKDDLFDDVHGDLSEGFFTLGDDAKRYCFEARETSYD